MPATAAPAREDMKPLFVGTMNDGLFIIDQPPRPAPVDFVSPDQNVQVIAKMVGNGALALRYAHAFAAAPDMLAALETLLAAAAADGWPAGWGLVQSRARAAIIKAKAEGTRS